MCLVLAEPLDRETRESYFIAITATELESPFRTVTELINVTVSDVNDNAPVFNIFSLAFSIIDGTEENTFVGKVIALDDDLNQQIR